MSKSDIIEPDFIMEAQKKNCIMLKILNNVVHNKKLITILKLF